jgi:hypothetical protein
LNAREPLNIFLTPLYQTTFTTVTSAIHSPIYQMSRYVSSQFIKTITTGANTIAVEYVDKTTGWTRPSGFPTSTVKEEFAKVAEDNAASLKAETVKVAMKYDLTPFAEQEQSDR